LHIIPSEIISQLEADIAENLARLLGLTQAQILPYITIVSVNGTAPSSRRLLSADGTTFVLVSFVIDSAVSDVHSSISVDLAVSKFTSAAQTGQLSTTVAGAAIPAQTPAVTSQTGASSGNGAVAVSAGLSTLVLTMAAVLLSLML
jgi:hypothetical protein